MISKINQELIVDLFKTGKNTSQISKELSIPRNTVRHNLLRLKLLSPPKPKGKFNENYFEYIDTEEKAYFLGFIVADGSISKVTNRVCFDINTKDKEILEGFKCSVLSTNQIRNYKVFDDRTKKYYDKTVFQVSSKKLKEDLKNLGVDENKSYSFLKPEIDKEYFWHFLRGMVDGDGHISNTKMYISLISTKEFLLLLVELLSKENIRGNKNLFALNREKNVWRTTIEGEENVLPFLENLYSNSKRRLQRKYDNYLKLLEVRKQFSKGVRQRTVKVLDKITGNKINEFKSIKDCMNFYKLSTTQFYYKKNSELEFIVGDLESIKIFYNA